MVEISKRAVYNIIKMIQERNLESIKLSTTDTGIVEMIGKPNPQSNHWIVASNGRLIYIGLDQEDLPPSD